MYENQKQVEVLKAEQDNEPQVQQLVNAIFY